MAKLSGEFEYEIEISEEVFETFDVEYEFELVHDPHYGADADGRRGVPMDFIEDLEITIKNSKKEDVTDYIQATYPEAYKEISDKVDKEANEDADDYDPEAYKEDLEYDDFDDEADSISNQVAEEFLNDSEKE